MERLITWLVTTMGYSGFPIWGIPHLCTAPLCRGSWVPLPQPQEFLSISAVLMILGTGSSSTPQDHKREIRPQWTLLQSQDFGDLGELGVSGTLTTSDKFTMGLSGHKISRTSSGLLVHTCHFGRMLLQCLPVIHSSWLLISVEYHTRFNGVHSPGTATWWTNIHPLVLQLLRPRTALKFLLLFTTSIKSRGGNLITKS